MTPKSYAMLCDTSDDFETISFRSEDSLDIASALDSSGDPFLLDETFSISSLSTISADANIPPCPGKEFYPTPSFFSQRFGNVTHADNALITTLTVPRLKNILVEPCLASWLTTLVKSEAPGHVPWGEPPIGASYSWKPEGSLFTRDEFAEALSGAKRSREPFLVRREQKRKRRTSGHPNSNRNALVFERQIMLQSGGKTRRMSLQVPASTMQPEMVDMMIELQEINSFFKSGLEDVDESVALLDQQKEQLSPPHLMVSNSHSSFPLPLESSGNLTLDAPLTLAARRGKSPLPPLSVHPGLFETPYPSIPTAFLGSPVDTPQFGRSMTTTVHALNLQDMVANLRSKCAAIQSYPRNSAVLTQVLPSDSMQAIRGSDEEDDWAFADSLLAEYEGKRDTYTLDNRSPVTPTADASFSDFASPTTPVSSEQLDFDVEKNLKCANTRRRTIGAIASKSSFKSPLPSMQQPMRSILKSSKNVRFASLPSRSRASVELTPPKRSRHLSTEIPLDTPLERPTRVRYTYCPKSLPSTPAPVASAVQNMVSPLCAIKRPAKSEPLVMNSSMKTRRNTMAFTPTQIRPLLRPQSEDARSKSISVSFGTSPLSRTPKMTSSSAKENYSNKRPVTSRWTMNEISPRHKASESSLGEKSKKRAPLRSILPRFK